MYKEGDVKILDIETNGFLEDFIDHTKFPYSFKTSAKIHVISIRDYVTNEVVSLTQKDITKERLKKELKDAKIIITHNGLKFDLVFLKLYGILDYSIGYYNSSTIFGEKTFFCDTLILSRLLNPDRGGHSLDAYGKRLGNNKMDFRARCIKEGIIEKNAKKGAEFEKFTPLMVEYCEQDTSVTKSVFDKLIKEKQEFNSWDEAIKMEHKLADLSIRRETLGFAFDKKLAYKLIRDLENKIEETRQTVNNKLPPRRLNQTEQNFYTPPKTQITSKGRLSKYFLDFIKRIEGDIVEKDNDKLGFDYYLMFEGNKFKLPINGCVKDRMKADISDLDHVKQYLIEEYKWKPTEWSVRDLTIDSKKKKLPYKKRVEAYERWLKDTLSGKYKNNRLRMAFERFKVKDVTSLTKIIKKKLEEDYPIIVDTAPKIKIGVQKELDPKLLKISDSNGFVKAFADFTTYRHRKSTIYGGDTEGVDIENIKPETGYLAHYREEDGRVSTPAIEIGASTSRYTHKNIANIPRTSSVYGWEMRSLFGCGKDSVFFGYDFSSLEARIMAHYVMNYPKGQELAKQFVAEKPNDFHSIKSRELGIPRGDCKSLNYGILYGCQPNKIMSMLDCSIEQAKDIFDGFWDGSPALKTLKEALHKHWENNGKKSIKSLDGRMIRVRSPHSMLNSLFQSAGIIFAKYVTVIFNERLEKLGYCTNPFEGKPDVCSMIEYHDEADLFTNPKLYSFKTFKTEDEAKEFVKNWNGEQLSDIGHSEKGYFVALPNVLSKELTASIKDVKKMLGVNVDMGYEYMVGRNWAECH